MKLFNDAITTRFNTLETNIKSKSNSFYDSYLDLLEATIKYMLDENNIDYDETRTCGYLVKEESIMNFLILVLKVDDYTYKKLPDYIKKCNDHKHKREKTLGVESVINYLKVYFDLINYYLDYIKGVRVEYNAEYFTSIFGETVRLNSEYKEEVLRLKDELKELYETSKMSEQDIEQYKSLLSIRDIELLNLDEQNQKLQAQISVLKDIKVNSLEEKLNKTLELLMNLTDSVVENRAVSIAIGESIIGQDITKTEYMNKAKQAIEKKNQNLFDKINANSEELARLSGKFSKVELEELCKLADRTLEVNDYDGAKKLYNQVLLLNPNNWKAEFYVTALNLYGTHYPVETALSLEYRDKLYEKTFENVMNMKTGDAEIVKALTDVFKLVSNDLDTCVYYSSKHRKEHINSLKEKREEYKRNQFKQNKSFEEMYSVWLEDVYEKAYFGIELAILSVIKYAQKIPYQQFKEEGKRFAEIFMNYVNDLELNICNQITEEDIKNIISLSNIDFKYDYSFETYKRGRKD